MRALRESPTDDPKIPRKPARALNGPSSSINWPPGRHELKDESYRSSLNLPARLAARDENGRSNSITRSR